MKRITMIIALFLGVTVFAQAQTQTKKTPEQKAQHQVEKMQKKLKLTADQTTKVKHILLVQDTRVDSLKKTATHKDKAAFKAKHEAIELAGDKQLKMVLNATQLKSYEQFKAEKKEKVARKKADKAKA